MGKRIYKNLRSLIADTIDIVLPRPRFCNGCGRQLKENYEYQLCAVCETYIHKYIQNDISVYGSLDNNIVKELIIACNYEDLAKELVYKIKYKDKRECAITLASYMARALNDKLKLDCIVPVPISLRKLKKRGYNHVALIADELGRLIGLPVYESLIRIKDTKPQVLFNERERWYNVNGCFSCNMKLKNLHVLLIDDLITTGATVFYCSTELLKAGAEDVTALAFARSIRF